ncbi:MAG TPA: hypothetical protein P5110_07420 [Candidatus Omnitrophota bacterium]|nr:hypothetical protein [Candidatus Omnitrophota bacterium]
MNERLIREYQEIPWWKRLFMDEQDLHSRILWNWTHFRIWMGRRICEMERADLQQSMSFVRQKREEVRRMADLTMQEKIDGALGDPTLTDDKEFEVTAKLDLEDYLFWQSRIIALKNGLAEAKKLGKSTEGYYTPETLAGKYLIQGLRGEMAKKDDAARKMAGGLGAILGM